MYVFDISILGCECLQPNGLGYAPSGYGRKTESSQKRAESRLAGVHLVGRRLELCYSRLNLATPFPTRALTPKTIIAIESLFLSSATCFAR
jgi:hypothetical protein